MKVKLARKIKNPENVRKIRKCGAEITCGYDADIALVDFSFGDFKKYKNLKWIHTSNIGADSILTHDIKKSDVILTNSKGMRSPVHEHALGMMIAFERNLKHAFEAQRIRKWDRFESGEIYGKTVGIVGAGSIGMNIARLCKAFGCRTTGIRKSCAKTEYIDNMLPLSKLHVLLKESDYVVVCVPLTDETYHLLGQKEFAMMKRTAVVVNVGRGHVVDEKALIDALKSGKIAGACLDVFENEPLPKSSPLWGMKNVIITCHYSAWNPNYEDRMIEIFCKNLAAFKSGKKLMNVVDKEKGY